MGDGYVLDFSDRTFAEFFRDFDIDIDDARYAADGTSKAKRLRRFLRSAEPQLVGKVLGALLDYRLSFVRGTPPQGDLDAYRKLVERLVGPPQPASEAPKAPVIHKLDPTRIHALKLDPQITQLLVDRVEEAQACFEVGAHLATVILAGSILEGLFLGFGKPHEQLLRPAYRRRDGRPTPPVEDWGLSDWLGVLLRVNWLSPNVASFAHGVRDFRNYVHPQQQLRYQFTPDRGTASIALQIVGIAIDDLSRVDPTAKGTRNG
jgi:hypothetical protein